MSNIHLMQLLQAGFDWLVIMGLSTLLLIILNSKFFRNRIFDYDEYFDKTIISLFGISGMNISPELNNEKKIGIRQIQVLSLIAICLKSMTKAGIFISSAIIYYLLLYIK